MAFDGQVYTDGKDYPMQGALRRGYGEDTDFSGPNDRDYRILMTPGGPERVLDWSRLAPTQGNYRVVQGLYAYWSNKADISKRILSSLSRLPFGGARESAEKEYKKRQALRDYFAQGLRRWPTVRQQPVPPVVRQGYYPSQQTIPSDLRDALQRALARRAQARTQDELRALQVEIARLQQLMTAQQVASVQQTAPAVTQYAPAPTVSAVPETSYVPEDAVQPMISAEDMEAKKVGLNAAEGAAAEEPTFIEKYGLFLGLAAVAGGAYYYMNRKAQAAAV
jgi:hypothetical protein